MTNNILIINKYEITRQGLKSIFETSPDFQIIYEAPDLKKAIEILNNNDIDLIIKELSQPEDIDLIKKIRTTNKTVKILILSSYHGEKEVLTAIKCGINAYCLKDITPKTLKTISKTVIEGACWFSPKISDIILKSLINTPYKGIEKIKNDYNLTIREGQILKLITEGKNNNEIAKNLIISLNTTKAHVARILQKLAVNDRLQAAIKAIKYELI